MIKLLVWGKAFGKPLITYKVFDTEVNNVIDEGKCAEYEKISEIYFGMIRKHGQENVKLLSR